MMIPSLHNLSIDARKRSAENMSNGTEPDERSAFVSKWLKTFKKLNFQQNFAKARELRERARREEKYYYDLLKDEEVEDMHWTPNFDKYDAVRLDKEKGKVVSELQELLTKSPVDVAEKIVTIHTEIAENMEMMKQDPSASLWNLMKDLIDDMIERFHEVGDKYAWEDGNVDEAQSGSALDQHGYFDLVSLIMQRKEKDDEESEEEESDEEDSHTNDGTYPGKKPRKEDVEESSGEESSGEESIGDPDRHYGSTGGSGYGNGGLGF